MDEAVAEITRLWLLKARNDLDTARQLAALAEGHLDTAIYHCLWRFAPQAAPNSV